MFAVLLSAISSYCLLYALIPHLSRLIVDEPNDRSSHSLPTPRGGGVVFVLIATISSVLSLSFGISNHSAVLSLYALPLAFVGLLDDRFNLASSLRYVCQLFTAIILLHTAPHVFTFDASGVSGFLCQSLIAVGILIVETAIINFTNFMDGLDGLVAGCMGVTIATLAVILEVEWPIWALVGSLLGFLVWNWSPAKVFMGDVGSYFLGVVFVGMVLQAPNFSIALEFLLVATPLLGDASLCILRRLLAGQNVFQAHRSHLFQRLHRAGWSHSCVSCAYICATIVLAIALLTGGLIWLTCLSVACLLVGVWLDQRVAMPFVLAGKS